MKAMIAVHERAAPWSYHGRTMFGTRLSRFSRHGTEECPLMLRISIEFVIIVKTKTGETHN